MRETLLVFHMLGLALGVGVSFTHLFLGVSRAKMAPEEAKKDALRSLALGIMGDIGIAFLLVSGIFLMGPYWNSLFDSPLLMVKLIFVILLITLLIILKVNSRRAKRDQGGPGLDTIKKLGKFVLLLGVAIVVLAVIFFK